MTRRDFLAASTASAVLAAACGSAPPRRTGVWRALLPHARVAQALVVDGGGDGSFGPYLVELLGAAGVVGLRLVDARQSPTSSADNAPSLVVYGRNLSEEWVTAVAALAAAGRTVVAIDPPPSLLAQFGVSEDAAPDGSARGVDLLKVSGGDRLRLHVPTRSWRTEGAGVDAWFTSVSLPAVLKIPVQRGTVFCWAFDVVRNVALIRQGNPAWVNRNRLGSPEVRLEDALYGWVRPERMDRPDADVFMTTLMAQLSAGGGADAEPVVCVDYFPGTARSVLVATSDSHWGGADVLDSLVRRVEQFGARLTIYYEPPETPAWRQYARRARWAASELPMVGPGLRSAFAPPSPQLVAGWRARGHEFAPHPDVSEGLEAGLEAAWQRFADDGYGRNHTTVRTHQVLWEGWVDTPRAQRKLGVRMNLDAYALGQTIQRANGTWAHGHVIGSGIPARFVDEDGEVVDCYQQPTQIVDEQLLAVTGGLEQLTGAQALEVAVDLLTRALKGPPAALCGQFHADGFAPTLGRADESGVLLDGALTAFRAANVPIWTAAHWLTFLDARREASIDARVWDSDAQRLTCTIALPASLEPGIALLVPAARAGRHLDEVRLNGAVVAPDTTTRGGVEWARVVARPGSVRLDARYSAST